MNQFKNILYVLHPHGDENPQSLARVISLTNNNQAELTLLRIIPKPSLSAYTKQLGINDEDIAQKIQNHEEAKLRELLAFLRPTALRKLN